MTRRTRLTRDALNTLRPSAQLSGTISTGSASATSSGAAPVMGTPDPHSSGFAAMLPVQALCGSHSWRQGLDNQTIIIFLAADPDSNSARAVTGIS